MRDIKQIKLFIILIFVVILALALDIGFQFLSINSNLVQVESRLHNIEEELKEVQPINPPKFRYVIFTLKITAYSSDRWQCDHDPFVGAWNNPVKDGMVAVSRDLEKIGITNKCPVIIGGIEYEISDRMHWRKRKHLDIWMKSKKEARNWGVQIKEVKILIDYIDLNQLFKRYKVRMVI